MSVNDFTRRRLCKLLKRNDSRWYCLGSSTKRWILWFAHHQPGNYNFKWSILISDRPGKKTLNENAEIQFAYQPVSTICSRFFHSLSFFMRFGRVSKHWRSTVVIALLCYDTLFAIAQVSIFARIIGVFLSATKSCINFNENKLQGSKKRVWNVEIKVPGSLRWILFN